MLQVPLRLYSESTFVASWFHRQGSTGIAQQLIWFFVHANDRVLSIVRPFINIQHVFHASYEFGVFFRWDAPVVVLVGADFVFKILATVDLQTGFSSTTLVASAIMRTVHFACPSGTGPQAISINWASARPSTFCLLWFEPSPLFNVRAFSRPLSKKLWTRCRES